MFFCLMMLIDSFLPGNFDIGLGAEEARWRRSGEFIAQSPGCRQGTILAQVMACPAAGLCGLGTFWFDDATSGSRRSHVGSNAAEPGPRRAILADVATRAAQSEHILNFGREKQAYRERATQAW